MAPQTIDAVTTKPRRFESLDALRGLAILGMCWSGMVPSQLPAWMFHAQVPPPDHIFNPDLPGLTWVDLVFPFFLFALGAAIPLALAGKIAKGESTRTIVLGVLQRGFLIAAYALIGEHLRPYTRSEHPDTMIWLESLLGFAAIALMLFRWPKGLDRKWQILLALGGWGTALALVFNHTYADGRFGFANFRNDIILMVMANVAVSGGLTWYFTRTRPLLRLAVYGAVLAIYLTAAMPGGMGKFIWDLAPSSLMQLSKQPWGSYVPVVYHFEYHKYLMIVLPGTVCGDFMARATQEDASDEIWGRWRSWLIVLGGPIACAIACWGLFVREVLLVTAALFALSALLTTLVQNACSEKEKVVSQCFHWGAGFLVIGLLLEPFGGGIKKDHATLSYFLVTPGLGFMMVGSLTSLFDLVRAGRWMRTISQCGANPIFGYLATTNLVGALSALLYYGPFISNRITDPWTLAFLQGGVMTATVAIVTAAFTRRGWFLRA